MVFIGCSDGDRGDSISSHISHSLISQVIAFLYVSELAFFLFPAPLHPSPLPPGSPHFTSGS